MSIERRVWRIGVVALSLAGPVAAGGAEPDVRERIAEMERELARLKKELPMEKPRKENRTETADTLDREFRVERGAVFSLSNVSGEIVVETWDRPAIGIRAAKKGKGSEEIEIRIHHDTDELRIETCHPKKTGWSWGAQNPRVDYVVRLPRRLLEKACIASVSGNVRLSETDAREIRITTVSGNIRAERCQGTLSLNTVSGDASAEVETDRLKAQTVSGDFRIALTPTDGKRWEVAANSVSGDVEVLLPKGSGARYAFTSMSGNARVRPGSNEARRRAGRQEGTIGDGQGEISARSVSGDLLLSEK